MRQNTNRLETGQREGKSRTAGFGAIEILDGPGTASRLALVTDDCNCFAASSRTPNFVDVWCG
jgi:hypothetical protein